MRIQTNLESLNAYRNLNTTNRAMSRSLERLSSGFRINRAADDAAGLSISEKMRGQISGLNQAVSNAQDGISLIQTAEGALNESHAILQRMRELASQAANDTLTSDDRQALQEEMDELTVEISRIAETTEFNTEELLEGGFEDRVLQIGANQDQTMEISIGDMRAEALGIAAADGIEIEVEGTVSNFDDETAAEFAIEPGEAYDLVGFEETKTVGDTSVNSGFDTSLEADYGLEDADGNIVAVSADGKEFTMLAEGTDPDSLDDSTEVAYYGNETYGSATAFDAFNFGDAVTGEVQFGEIDDDGDITAIGAHQIEFEDAELASGTYTVVDSDYHTVDNYGMTDSQGDLVAVSTDGQEWETVEGDDLFTVSSDNAFTTPGEQIEVTGDGGIDISTTGAATNALSTIDDAIDNVSTERSTLGAVQNRLDHTITNLEVAAENLTAAESRIRDVDMAAEMMEFTKSQILVQAGTSMLAQANMAPQAVLQLLG